MPLLSWRGCLFYRQPLLSEEVVRAARQAVLFLHIFVGREAACPVCWPNQHRPEPSLKLKLVCNCSQSKIKDHSQQRISWLP